MGIEKRYAGKVWKLLPILEHNRKDYQRYLFNLICDLASEPARSYTEDMVYRKLKGLHEINDIATDSEIRSIVLECSSLLYKEG